MFKGFIKRGLLIIFTITLLFSITIRSLYKQKLLEKQDNLKNTLLSIRSTLNRSINSNFNIIYVYSSHISVHSDISEEEFTELSRELFKQYKGLKNITIAPNNIITNVYPIEGNEEVLGLDYRDIPSQYKQIKKAQELGLMILDGPIDLVQGGVGLIARVPVFNSRSKIFWGMVSSVINFKDLMLPVVETLTKENLKLVITNESSKKKDVIYGEKYLLQKQKSIYSDLPLHDRVWGLYLFDSRRVFSLLDYSIIILLYLLALTSSLLVTYSLHKKTKLIEYNISRMMDFSRTSQNWVWETDSNFNITYTAGSLSQITWGSPQFILGKNFRDIFKENNDMEESIEARAPISEKQWWVENIKYEKRCFSVSAVPYYKENIYQGYRGLCTDITDKILYEKERADYLKLVDEYIPISQTDLEGNITKSNSAYCRLSGYKESELIGNTHKIMRHPSTPSAVFKQMWETIEQGKTWNGEVRNLRRDGSCYWFNASISPLVDQFNRHYGYMAVRQDITAEKRLLEISETDQLTGIYNRRKLDSSLKMISSQYTRSKSDFSIIMLDIDFFKSCNDNFGHLVGDDVLKKLSQILLKNIRKTDILGRWGGEEFLIIAPNTQEDGAIKLAEFLRKTVEKTFFEGVKSITCSFGVSSTTNSSLDKITEFADKALYLAKYSGRNCVKFYDNTLK
ncbi:diguanylate cyclase [Thiospirochaeta perfilievii]|uniref:Diguanylate cyclase n=1 Tax=Thiospirochaeta perfilievii TaxID=252967 RepID=A0A5C1QCB9_9SPIO|nr:diguanylate cyclase [Thiospirochaeta perfilievii]QEN04306.1 diguanylate cyclase [Thiospirochaeta perfilievii]